MFKEEVVISKHACVMECPYCLSRVRTEALICKSCHAKITVARSFSLLRFLAAFLVSLFVLTFVVNFINLPFLKYIFGIDTSLFKSIFIFFLSVAIAVIHVRRKNEWMKDPNVVKFVFHR
ncbi:MULTISPECIES: hypothetical protein [Enterobacterales]|uniref:hypothetical protein n=1 Tax=Enterobacterales TaxID=91347 RepID=UPI002ED8395F